MTGEIFSLHITHGEGINMAWMIATGWCFCAVMAYLLAREPHWTARARRYFILLSLLCGPVMLLVVLVMTDSIDLDKEAKW